MSVALAACAGQPSDPGSVRQGTPLLHEVQGLHGLTAPSTDAPATVVGNYLAPRRDAAVVGSLVVRREDSAGMSGMTHLSLGQEAFGLPVFGTYAKATVDGQGRLVHLIENLAPIPDHLVAATVGASDARDAAVANLYTAAQTNQSGFFYRAPTVTRVAIPMDDGSMAEGFVVETWTAASNQLHHTLVGPDGGILGVQLRTNTDSYNIFPVDPGASAQALVAGPGAGNAESPAGWLAGSQTTRDIAGNNVHAYLDTDNNNASDGGGMAVADGVFGAVADLGSDPSTSGNRDVAVQNLFYLNNVLHDRLYAHGFDEAAGNFQNDNFGNGGAGGDAVNAEGQDGGGTNNANFSTPSDGSAPRMQMYLWDYNGVNPRRDGDVDSDIVYHEYGHGLTWRMIGNMSGPLSGAIGEGMSDVLSILFNNDPIVGEYAFNDPNGIRRASYDNYPYTYGDFSGEVHNDGEVYAAIIWRAFTTLRSAAGAGTLDAERNTLLDYLVGGMNYTNPGPTIEQMRDGILQAIAAQDPTSGDECAIWDAFAHYGVGVGASGSVKGGGPYGGGKVNIHESFATPDVCTGCFSVSSENCSDGVDNDCDGYIDAADSDCSGGSTGGGGVCDPDANGQVGVGCDCSSDSDCTSNKCKGPSGRKTCK